MNEIINGTNSPGRAAGDNDFNWAVFIQKTLLPALRCQKVNVRCEIIADEFIPKLKHYPISTSRGDSDAEAKSKAQEKAIVTGLVKVLYQVSGCYFADRKSRLSLLDALLAIGHQYPELFVEALGRLLIEDCDELIRVKSTASSERFRALKLVNCVLLVIHTRLLAGYSDGAASFASCSAIWEKLVYAQANLLYELATPTLTSLGKSALADTWRLLRGGKGSPGDAVLAVLERYLSYLLKSAPTGAGGPVYTVLLGSVISTANRLKSPPALAEQGRQFIAKHKPAILEFIRKNVLLAKVRPSNAVVTSLEDFLRDYLVNYDVDFKEALEPALKKAFLQTPETSLRALNFMAPLFGFGADRLFIEVVAEPLINSYTKSSNKVVKDDALELWSTLTRLCLLSDNTDGLRDVADKALIDPLVANKGGTPNNRVVMVQLVESLANLTERTGAASIVERLAELAGKEVNEPVQLAALRALSAHLPKLAAVNGGEIPEKVLDSIVKGLKLPEKSVKVRKAWVADVVGQFFMLTKGAEMPDEIAAALWSLVEKFEEKPLVHPAGPLEGYVAVAVGLKSLPPDSKYRRKLVQTITTFTPKPSFLLWDKVYHKVSDPEEISWELQALEAFFVHVLADGETKALPQEAESMFAEAFMWILTGPPSTNHKITEAVLSKLRSLTCTDARRLSAVVLPVLFKHMDEHASPEQGGSASLARRWFGVLASLAQVSQTTATDSGELYTLLIELGLAAHHPAIIRFLHPKYSWVMLVQAAGANPGKLFEEYFGEIEARIFSALEQHSSPDSPRHQAALKWVEVMAFIGGTEAVMGFIDRVSEYLAPKALLDISAEEIAIYYTPEGTLYRDPLNRAKAVEDKNRRDYATEKWERELREDLARKNKLAQKGQVRKLTKEEQAAFDARKAIEDQARAKVKTIADRALRGLEVICATVRGNSEATSRCILQIVRLVVFGAVAKGRVGRLIGADAVSAAVSEIGGAAIGLGDPIFLRTVSIATLRVLGRGDDVPEEWRQEPIDDLLVRILFRVRMGSEVEPLTLSAFNYLFPLIQAVLDHDGFGKRYATTGRQAPQPTDEYAPVDKTSEQVIYCVDILAAHVPLARSEAGEAVLPRKEMIYALFKTMENRPQLIQSARSALIRLAEVMEPTLTTAAEREAFLSGLMSGDEMIRQAALEALDYVDLTDYSYSAPIWLAICGEMSANLAELGLDLWQENSMVVAPGLVEDLLTYLHMGNNSHVRQAAAFGIVQAVRELLGLPLRFASEAGSRRDEGREEEEEGPNSVAQSTVKLTPEVAALVKSLVAKLLQMYRDAYISLKPEYDEYGMVVPGTEDKRDPWETRESVAEVLRLLAPYLDSGETITSIMEFLVKSDDALGDRQDSVREHMLSVGIAMVRAQGSKYIMQLMPLLEEFLAQPDRGSEAHDRMREGAVILLGSLAQHLSASDKRVTGAVQNLVATLSTPSESVQIAVAGCLPPLVRRLPAAEGSSLIQSLLQSLIGEGSYAERRGAAYGLAGAVKGKGLRALYKLRVIDAIEEACNDKKNVQARQGALFALETFPMLMGRLFEPYVVRVIQLLLAGFSDPNAGVREAATDASRVIMGKLTAFGLKQVLPILLKGLASDQWRTKKGSVEMLGSMAFCAPRMLSRSLPTIVPEIVNAVTDSHMQVATAARQALEDFGGVIHNPEVQAIVPKILAALADPNLNTSAALNSLIATAFVHYIDAPSLALVMPVLHRGMQERAAAIKRQAAQIVGSMATLTETQDLVPYLSSLVPLLRKVLIDPVPETRATSARALGSLVAKLGESRFPGLIADLLRTLRSDKPGADRSGAAQGLSEVLAGIGIERLETLMPEIVSSCSSSSHSVRQGFMTLMIFLPVTFGDSFEPYLTQVLPPILTNLADENEPTREASMRAGRILVIQFAQSASNLFLDEFMQGLNSRMWRTRQASVELLGDLLFRIAGLNSKQAQKTREAAQASSAAKEAKEEVEGDEEAFGEELGEEPGMDEEAERSDEEGEELEDRLDPTIIEQAKKLLGEALGVERRNQIFSAIYIARNDVAAAVRHSAIGVWKTLVTNSPRTVKECIEPMMELILTGLASDNTERRTTCARALGDLVRKLGESVMSRIIPILEKTLNDPSASDIARQGACVGLSDILMAAGRSHVEEYAELMIPLVRRGLCDPAVGVREASAAAFSALQRAIGTRAIDEVVPYLLGALKQQPSPTSADTTGEISRTHALAALRELMAVKASSVFPVLIPTLTAHPISAFHANALSSLMEVTGAGVPGVSSRLPQIVSALFDSLPEHRASGDKEAEAAVIEAVRTVVAVAASDEYALEQLMMLFHENIKEPTAAVGAAKGVMRQTHDVRRSRQVETCHAFEALCLELGPNSISRTDDQMGPHVADWLGLFITMLASPSAEAGEAAWRALDALVKALRKEDYETYVPTVYDALQTAIVTSPTSPLVPGLCQQKSIGPLLPVFTQGLLTGSAENKERSARGMADLVKAAPADQLRPFVTGLAGPLIRTIGDRHVPAVKAAILQTLGTLLTTLPTLLRPFLPQLQRSFVRCLSDPDVALRGRASKALDALIPLQSRLDPLVTELTAGIKASLTTNPGDPTSVGTAIVMLHALRSVLRAPGAKALSAASTKSIEQVILHANEEGTHFDQRIAHGAGKALGALCAVLPQNEASQLVVRHALVDPDSPQADMTSKLRVLGLILAEAPTSVIPEAPKNPAVSKDECVSAVVSSIVRGLQSGQPAARLQAVLVAKTMLTLPQLATTQHADSRDQVVSALLDLVSQSSEGAADVDSDTKQAVFIAFKTLAKQSYDLSIKPIRNKVVLAAMDYIRDRMIPLKLAAERCILYTLRLAGEGGSRKDMDEFIEQVKGSPDEDKANKLRDYHRRVLARLADATREAEYETDIEDQASSASINN